MWEQTVCRKSLYQFFHEPKTTFLKKIVFLRFQARGPKKALGNLELDVQSITL